VTAYRFASIIAAYLAGSCPVKVQSVKIKLASEWRGQLIAVTDFSSNPGRREVLLRTICPYNLGPPVCLG